MSELKAGRKLDAKIHWVLFGRAEHRPLEETPAYSTDANACALVKTKMMELGYEITINYYPGKPRWRTSLFSPHKDLLDSWADGGTEVESFCLAALKATEGKK